MRSQIIAEEEAKEDQIQVVQDPKPNDSGFFYAKQEKYKQNSKFYKKNAIFFHKMFHLCLEAIDPEIDLTQLNRNENLDGETAVLKQPLDLNAIQQLPIIEEGVIKEEDADFPDDKEKRGTKSFKFSWILTPLNFLDSRSFCDTTRSSCS